MEAKYYIIVRAPSTKRLSSPTYCNEVHNELSGKLPEKLTHFFKNLFTCLANMVPFWVIVNRIKKKRPLTLSIPFVAFRTMLRSMSWVRFLLQMVGKS